MSFSPYLHFQGNCAEAMQAYATIFGAGDLMIMRYKEAPPNAQMQASDSDKVMHSQLTVGGQMLMASDYPAHMAGAPQAAVSISHSVTDMARGQTVFDALAKGGDIIMPFGPTFFAKGFGMVKDRFGTHWMVMGPDNQA
jgi:PhnB protein